MALFTFALLIVMFVAWFFSGSRILKTLSGTPQTLISRIRGGTSVKIVGRVEYLGEPMRAPLSGRKCAAYQIVIEEHLGKGNRRIIASQMRWSDFMVRDASGTARITAADVAHASLELVKDSNTTSGVLDDATPAERGFLEEQGLSPTGAFFNRTLSYQEGVLEAGELVAVAGVPTLEHDPHGNAGGAGYRDVAKRVVFNGSDAAHRLLITDDSAGWVGQPPPPPDSPPGVRVAGSEGEAGYVPRDDPREASKRRAP